jgi:hypothetical protein
LAVAGSRQQRILDKSDMTTAIGWLASWIGKALFLSEPASNPSDEKRAIFGRAFEVMRDGSSDRAWNYDCPYPKWEYLRYLVRERGVVLHGSNRGDIEVLEPLEQTDYSGKRIKAVFASRDGIWSMFSAILNTTGYRGSLRNGCWVVGRGSREQRFYFFSVNEQMMAERTWTEGMIYILPGRTFELTDRRVVRFDEWASREAVKPIAKLAVGPGDFPFLGQVAGHREGESILKSWLWYKRRVREREHGGWRELA